MMTSAHADDDGGGLHDPVNPPVAEIPITADGTARTTIHSGMAQRGGHPAHRLRLDDQFGGDEPDVQQPGRRGTCTPPRRTRTGRGSGSSAARPSLGPWVACRAISSAPIRVPIVIAASAHQNVRPMLDGDAAEDDVEDVDVGPEPEDELVPGLPVPCGGGDVLDMAVLDVPAHLLVARRGCGHSCSFLSCWRSRDAACGWCRPGWRPAIRSAARSATARTVACKGALTMTGITDASATRSPVMPWTRRSGSTTAPSSGAGRSGRCRPGGSSCRPSA